MAETQIDHRVLDHQLAGLLDAPHWYVGLSGGVDSTVLLHLVQHWRAANQGAPPLTAIHINHGLQAPADDWQAHCESLCNLLRIPIVNLSADVQRATAGPEAAAREARYRAFDEQLQVGDLLFLGHHLDDQVETFFLRLLRGAGVRGLGAMPVTRPLGRGRLVRPLLQVTRAGLVDYARRHGLDYVQDPTNSDTALDRNFLRAELLPLLASRWPAYRRTVSRASEHIAWAAAALAEAFPAPATLHGAMGDPGVALSELINSTPEEAAVKLRHWLQVNGQLAPDQAALEEFLRQLRDSAEQASPRLRCSAFTLQRFRDAVYLLPDSSAQPAPGSFQLHPGETREVAGIGQLGLDGVAADGLLLAADEAVDVAWRQGGERCRPRGRAGSNSLKTLLQERDVPPWWRDRLPLLYLDGELLAVGDLWLCDSSRWREAAQPGQLLWRPRWRRETPAAFD